eukprot:gene9136-biopygen9172
MFVDIQWRARGAALRPWHRLSERLRAQWAALPRPSPAEADLGCR